METSVISFVRVVNREFRVLLCPDDRLDTTPAKVVDEAVLESLARRMEQARDFIDPLHPSQQDFRLHADVAELLENLDRVNSIRQAMAPPPAETARYATLWDTELTASALDGHGHRITSAQAQRGDAFVRVAADHFEN